MNKFDLGISPISRPNDVDASAGSQALRELTALQSDDNHTSRRLSLRGILTNLLTGYDAGNAPFTMSSGRSGIAIS